MLGSVFFFLRGELSDLWKFGNMTSTFNDRWLGEVSRFGYRPETGDCRSLFGPAVNEHVGYPERTRTGRSKGDSLLQIMVMVCLYMFVRCLLIIIYFATSAVSFNYIKLCMYILTL